MQVSFLKGKFICRCSFDDRNIPKEAGFYWNPIEKIWYTEKISVATRLHPYFDENAKKKIKASRIVIDTWTGGLSVPKGLELYDFQESGCLFSLSRNRSYLGFDPGLGKTPMAAVIAQTLVDHNPPFYGFVYICPPFLTRNTKAEFERWAPRLSVEIYNPGTFGSHSQVLIIPDSILIRDSVRDDILQFETFFKTNKCETVIFIDEAHRYKNDEAKRTESLFGGENTPSLVSKFDRQIYMSGTPMPNRPIELFSILNAAAPECIHSMNKFEYAQRYCAAFEHSFGWDFNGESNLDELRAQVYDKFMLRVRKATVLKSLPPKTEEMVILNEDLPVKFAKLSSDILKHISVEDLMKGQIQANLGKEVLHLSTYRKELGTLKVKAAAEFIKYILDETEENLLVFAIHKATIAGLTDALSKYSPLVVTGETPMETRHSHVNEFQTERGRRIFIGNIQAAGVGLTLTKATRVVFVEFSWVPSDNDQASDRTHRIGQADNVLVQYLVHQNSVDKAVIETVLKKKKVTAAI